MDDSLNCIKCQFFCSVDVFWIFFCVCVCAFSVVRLCKGKDLARERVHCDMIN